MDLWLPDSYRLARAEHMPADRDLARQMSGHHLTTAEMLYEFPDHPLLLQTYVWQDYDLLPRFPVLQKFITFWQQNIEGKLHRVTVSVREALGDARFTFYADEIELN